MEESWKEKIRANNSRARIADTLVLYSNMLALYIWQKVKALVSYGSAVEASLRKSILGHGEKGMSDHERRKYESKSSNKNTKLRQFITLLRTGRLGYVLLAIAALAMLAVYIPPASLQHADKEFEITTRANKERGVDLTFNRKVKLTEETNLIFEEGKKALKMAEDKPEIFTNILDSKVSAEYNASSKEKTAALLTSHNTRHWQQESVDTVGEAVNKLESSANEVKLAGVSDIVKPDVNVIEQELKADNRQENGAEWPQESVHISSLRRRAALGTLTVGLLNMKPTTDIERWQFLAGKRPIAIPFQRVSKTVVWVHLYPEWIDEPAKYGFPKCPLVPMAKIPAVPYVSPAVKLDVVIARAPCAASSTLQEGWRHPASLQVLLGAANLAVKTGNESIYVLILSKCRPLVNLFPCGELLEHRDQGWLYQMNTEQLRKRISLPVGSCQLSVSLGNKFYVKETALDIGASNSQKEAYATILHSGADYVCGAIAAAQSIRRTGSTRDLIILVDSSISPEHRQALEEAGWKVRDLVKISASSSFGRMKDFSIFRLWQLNYDKVIYVEADILVLRNLDHLFRLPEVSASGTTNSAFNAGVMVIEPSNCTFQILMDEMEKLVSEVVDDWDFLNKVFPWWHRIPRNMNFLRYFWTRQNDEADDMNRLFSSDPPQLYAIHYVGGQKPWKCFRDYDCNWNSNQHYASDEAHAQWFKVYDQMPENLQKHCALSTRTKSDLEYDRRIAQSEDFPDRHWSINITDPRLNVCQDNHCDLKVCQLNHCDWNAMLKTVNTINTGNTTNTVVASMK